MVTEDLLKNGLELESVSLTSLDQTDREFFNPNNAFDAEGLTKLTEEIEARRKQRNDIERDTQVAVEQKNLDAEQRTLEIKKQEEYARLDQQREVEVRRAQQKSQIASEQADRNREAEEARIGAERAIEQAQIGKEQRIRETDIERQRTIETADLKRQETVAIADQMRAIAVALKSKEQSEADAEADRARAIAVDAEEGVKTVRETAVAERQKAIELVEARKQAERQAIGITVAAQAEKDAAIDHAEAIKTSAEGKASGTRIEAQGEAEAEKLRADAAGVRYTVDADGKRALNEAENLLSNEVILMRIKLSLIENLDRIIRESVKPMEAIDDIKIIQVDGLGGNGHAHGVANGNGGDGNLADSAVNAALRYRAQAPLLDSLLKEIGLAGGDINGLTSVLTQEAAGDGAPTPEGKKG